ncbi:lasso RiPP family leader peptide-containing protein [Streptomyces sp. NPDC057638]
MQENEISKEHYEEPELTELGDFTEVTGYINVGPRIEIFLNLRRF